MGGGHRPLFAHASVRGDTHLRKPWGAGGAGAGQRWGARCHAGRGRCEALPREGGVRKEDPLAWHHFWWETPQKGHGGACCPSPQNVGGWLEGIPRFLPCPCS